MGMFTVRAVPPEPLSQGRYWSTDNVKSDSRRLHPTWDSWPPNCDNWASEVVDKVMAEGHKFFAINADDLQNTPRIEIEKALATTWHSMKAKYLESLKGQEEKLRKNREARRTTRKHTVRTLSF